jgi:gamma-glutamyl-gamma-aminobutyrate hydrolase PuuD
VGAGLEVTGRATDGTVEVLESTGDWWAIGVQWHPERLDLSDERPLFEAIVQASAG